MSIDLNTLVSNLFEQAVAKAMEPINDQLFAIRRDIGILDEAVGRNNQTLATHGRKIEERFDDSALGARLENIEMELQVAHERLQSLNVHDLTALVTATAERVLPKLAEQQFSEYVENHLETSIEQIVESKVSIAVGMIDLDNSELCDRIHDAAVERMKGAIQDGGFSEEIGAAVRDYDFDEMVERAVDKALESGTFSFQSS